MARKKHQPQRTCVGCREVQEKRSLIRLVRTQSGVVVDLEGKVPGRGAYLHDRLSCWEQGLKGPLEKALRTNISAEDRGTLRVFMDETVKPAENSE